MLIELAQQHRRLSVGYRVVAVSIEAIKEVMHLYKQIARLGAYAVKVRVGTRTRRRLDTPLKRHLLRGIYPLHGV